MPGYNPHKRSKGAIGKDVRAKKDAHLVLHCQLLLIQCHFQLLLHLLGGNECGLPRDTGH